MKIIKQKKFNSKEASFVFKLWTHHLTVWNLRRTMTEMSENWKVDSSACIRPAYASQKHFLQCLRLQWFAKRLIVFWIFFFLPPEKFQQVDACKSSQHYWPMKKLQHVDANIIDQWKNSNASEIANTFCIELKSARAKRLSILSPSHSTALCEPL